MAQSAAKDPPRVPPATPKMALPEKGLAGDANSRKQASTWSLYVQEDSFQKLIQAWTPYFSAEYTKGANRESLPYPDWMKRMNPTYFKANSDDSDVETRSGRTRKERRKDRKRRRRQREADSDEKHESRKRKRRRRDRDSSSTGSDRIQRRGDERRQRLEEYRRMKGIQHHTYDGPVTNRVLGKSYGYNRGRIFGHLGAPPPAQ